MPNQAEATPAAAGAGMDGGRKPTVVPAPAAANPELSGRPVRRTFTAVEKLGILKEADQAASTGVIGATGANQGTLHDDAVHFLDDPQSGLATSKPDVDAGHGRHRDMDGVGVGRRGVAARRAPVAGLAGHRQGLTHARNRGRAHI